MEENKSFGEGPRLLKVLDFLNMDQGAAAELFGITQGTVSYWGGMDRLPNIWWDKHAPKLRTFPANIEFIRDPLAPIELPSSEVSKMQIMAKLEEAVLKTKEAMLLLEASALNAAKSVDSATEATKEYPKVEE